MKIFYCLGEKVGVNIENTVWVTISIVVMVAIVNRDAARGQMKSY